MRDREKIREEQRQYENDVFYEVWRSGGNPDRINDDRVSDGYWAGRDADDQARAELRAQRPKEYIPDPEEQSDSRIEQMIDEYQEGLCIGCGKKVDYQLMCATPIGDGPALCHECLGMPETGIA